MTQITERSKIIHSLSFASNSGFGKIFEDESTSQKSYEKLQEYVTAVSNKVLSDKRTQKYIGDDWETVWGPVVYSHDKNSSFARADNTMGVYFSKKESLFVIAIAGTNSISSFGWMKEDFHVNKTAVWKDLTGKGKGDISQGTATGLVILVDKMKDKARNDKKLLAGIKEYIESNNITQAEVAVTGHSLGGALSPALALYLSNKRKEWSANATIQMSTYPTAGPTIGVDRVDSITRRHKQDSFPAYYEQEIKIKNIKYHSVINSLDIVPLAWNKENLARIPKLYEDNGIKDVSFGTMALAAVLNTQKKPKKKSKGKSFKDLEAIKQYVYRHIEPTEVKKGIFDNKTEKEIKRFFEWLSKNPKVKDKYIPKSLQPNLENLKNTIRFFLQAGYQHVPAYNKLLGITEFMKEYGKVASDVKIDEVNASKIAMNSEQMVFGLASEAIGFDINSLLEIGELNDEELKKLTEEGEE